MAASAPAASVKAVEPGGAKDVGFAISIVFILTVLFLLLPASLIDIGLSLSITTRETPPPSAPSNTVPSFNASADRT